MRVIALLCLGLLLSACGTTTRTDVIQYRTVVVTPVVEDDADEVIITNDDEPVDVTTTTVEYY